MIDDAGRVFVLATAVALVTMIITIDKYLRKRKRRR